MARFSDLLGGDPGPGGLGTELDSDASTTDRPGTDTPEPDGGVPRHDADGETPRHDPGAFARLAREQADASAVDDAQTDRIRDLGLGDLPPIDDDLLPGR